VTTAVTVYKGAASAVRTGGASVIAIYPDVVGGIIWNPYSASDQGLSVPETLYISAVGPAVLYESTTTTALLPGQFYYVTPGQTTNIWVNSASSGHKFSSIIWQPKTQYPPTSISAMFPPVGPTGLTTTLPSYLYQEYSDDDDLQAFVIAYNTQTQEYVDWFNNLNLPIYTTNPLMTGLMLDWVAAGLYGMRRPTLSSGLPVAVGPYNTQYFNQLNAYNELQFIGPTNVTATSDDVFKRILTWHFYKGDGKYFVVRWLKRRIARFLFGVSGTDYEGNTYQISVTFGPFNELNITILNGVAVETNSSCFNYLPGTMGNTYNSLNGLPYNGFEATFTPYTVPALSMIFQEAVATGALEMPFQYSPCIVNIYTKGFNNPYFQPFSP